MVHSPPLDFITSPRRLITNEKDAKVVHPKSLAGRVGGRVLEARLLGYGSIHCAGKLGNVLQGCEVITSSSPLQSSMRAKP
jgi:hypothetical protein